MHVVGRLCAECGQRILLTREAVWCACGYVAQRKCLPHREPDHEDRDMGLDGACPKCGASFDVTRRAEDEDEAARHRALAPREPPPYRGGRILAGCIILIFVAMLATWAFLATLNWPFG